MRKNLVLTGFMGTGKTTVGKLLAEELAYAFVDTDALIEMRLERSIPDIFAELGESVFRETEAAIAAELGEVSGWVVSTGGGLMMDPQNVAALSSGAIFCLVAEPEEILARVLAEKDAVERPLLAGEDPAARISELLETRAAVYGQFTQVETTGRSPREVMRSILEMLEEL